MARILIFPDSRQASPDGVESDTAQERPAAGEPAISPDDQLKRTRSEIQRELRGAILLLDLAVFRLRETAQRSGIAIPLQIAKDLETIDGLLDAARVAARKV